MIIYTYSPNGILGSLVKVEIDIRRGIPGVDIVGLPDHSVKEAKERIRSAFGFSGFSFPKQRVLLNLCPANLKKKGSGMDLALAMAIAQGIGLLEDQRAQDAETPEPQQEKVFVYGELGLLGDVKSTSGLEAGILAAMEEGISTMVLPVGTPKSLLSHFAAGTILAANLQEAVKLLSEVPASSPTPQFKERSFNWPKEILLNTEEKLLIQCFLVGGHPTILLGPPGVGKTTLAHAIKILRNRLSPQDMVEVAKVYAIAERPTSPILENTLIPWRAPHHSSSREGLLGGGQGLLPGELSLAHKGILFLDEGLEFSRHFWQSLREPLEEGVIRHARAGRSLEYPAQISLLISANPCACGSFGSENQTCLCSSGEIQQYWKKIGGPMRDRLAIRYWMNGGGERAPLQNPLAFVEGIEKAVKRRLRIPNTTLQEYLRKNATYREIAQIEDLARTLAAIRGGPAVSPEDQATAHSLRTGILGRIPWF